VTPLGWVLGGEEEDRQETDEDTHGERDREREREREGRPAHMNCEIWKK
jgi:hypothetical protein